MRAGLAPRAARRATSRPRPRLRASQRFATLAAAISSTHATAAASIHNASRDRAPTTWRLRGTTRTPRFRSAAGICASRRPAIALISVCASSTVTSGRSRPTTNHESRPRTRRRASQSGNSVCGSKTSASRLANRNASGRMPTTRDACPSRSTDAPSASSEPPNRACQKRWLMTATRRRSAASAAEKPRPCRGSMPSRGNRLGETLAPRTRRVSPAWVRVTDTPSNTARSAKLRLWPRHSSTFQYADRSSRRSWPGVSVHSMTSSAGDG